MASNAQESRMTSRRDPLDGCDFSVGGEKFRYLRVDCSTSAAPPQLTDSEWDVALRAAAGEASASIAAARRVSKRTVDHQLSSTFRKLGVSCRTELCARLLGNDGWALP